jgi:hypothetical protein
LYSIYLSEIPGREFPVRERAYGEDKMAEHVYHKKESKKAPQKTMKEKREEKKSKKKGSSGTNP